MPRWILAPSFLRWPAVRVRPALAVPISALLLVMTPTGPRASRASSVPPDPAEEVVVRPLPAIGGSGSGTFDNLTAAIDEQSFSGSGGAVTSACRDSCGAAVEKEAEWQGFPDGFEPFRLEVAWDATGGLNVPPGTSSEVQLRLEYDLGSGWELGEEDTWISEIPACSETHPSRCVNHTFVKELLPEQSTGVIKVRAFVSARMTNCNGICTPFTAPSITAHMVVRNIQVVARRPRLVVEPGTTVTRGDVVTFRVTGSPVTSYSNWRYESTSQGTITRTENINTGTWVGPLLVGGKGKVVVIIPGQSVSIALESASVTINPRTWNSLPLSPIKVTGIAPPPGMMPDPPADEGYMGYSIWELDGKFDSTKLGTDGPNKGLSYVTAVYHANWGGNYYKYEISPHLEPGTVFYSKQCGQGDFILGSVLRANAYEHESGTQKGHYQQYRDKLADPAVNDAKVAEPLIGSVSQSQIAFINVVATEFGNRRTQLHTAAAVQACNADFELDASCAYRGAINFFPYQPPCQ